ncbi:mitochondrial import receptor subunit TOM22 homolog isoform X2 [Cimex lectularius]|nr:mitochondrial import receptor subunit TOM22 homolog isoform X2 [Cimex lectularius]XP_014240552.1 mitochondrial import receptor subunit TOM22 homolog isoform X2 [Cimex lectularius]XP_014240553.1 mitochondrial import receptor subunit TOM22 homolog isoform X2 [Cimex lectularius]
MGSMPDSSKDVTPEKKRTSCFDDDSDDETLGERLWGLTEMFPEGVRSATMSLYCGTKSSLKYLYSLSRTTLWIFFSSSAILFAPVLFEVERAQVEEAQRTQQKQVLLGPNTAMAGGPGGRS